MRIQLTFMAGAAILALGICSSAGARDRTPREAVNVPSRPAKKAPPPEPEPGAEPWWRAGHQLTVEFGAGGDSGDLTAPNFVNAGGSNTFLTGLGAATAIQYSYRFNPWVAFGPRAYYYFMDADVTGVASTSEDSAFAVGIDLAVTGYPLSFSRVDPFVGLSVGYAMWTVPVIDPGGNTRHNYRLHGVTVQLNVGVDIYVTQYFSVGPVFRYHFPFWIQFCATGPGDKCERTEDLNAVNPTFDESQPGLIFVGAQAVFHIR